MWSDHSLDQQPLPPGPEVVESADELEINGLLEMKVLVTPPRFDGVVQGKLTTKFVRDWRKKKMTLGVEIHVSLGCVEASW